MGAGTQMQQEEDAGGFSSHRIPPRPRALEVWPQPAGQPIRDWEGGPRGSKDGEKEPR